jgi:hypothetical protein
MSFPRHVSVNLGRAYGGLPNVGLTLPGFSRINNIPEIPAGSGSGCYGAVINFPDDYQGPRIWDTGQTPPIYYIESMNPDEGYVDRKISSLTSAVPQPASGYAILLSASAGPINKSITVLATLVGGTILNAPLVVTLTTSTAGTFGGTITINPGSIFGSTIYTPTATGSSIISGTHTGGNAGMANSPSVSFFALAQDSNVPAAGAGSKVVTFTAQDYQSNPIGNAEVWVSTDTTGSNVVAGTLLTDSFGKVTFLLDPGAYYVWREHSNYSFTNPLSITVQ